MALDEPNAADEVLESGGFTFVVEKGLYQKAQRIRVDLSYLGFQVSSSIPLGDGGGCGGSCTC